MQRLSPAHKGGSSHLSPAQIPTVEFGDSAGVGTQMAVDSSKENPLLLLQKDQEGGKRRRSRKARRGGSSPLSPAQIPTAEFGDSAGVGTQMAADSSKANPLLHVQKDQNGGKTRRKHGKTRKSRKSRKHKARTHKGGRRRKYGRKTHKRRRMPWAGWGKEAPFGAARTRMYRDCGKKCFLGTKTPGDKQHPDFPICTKGTCDVNPKGVYAAFIRAREWGKKRSSYKGKDHPRLRRSTYKRIARKADRMLERMGDKR